MLGLIPGNVGRFDRLRHGIPPADRSRLVSRSKPDTARGVPAASMKVRIWRLESERREEERNSRSWELVLRGHAFLSAGAFMVVGAMAGVMGLSPRS